MQTKQVKVHAMNGMDARFSTDECALVTLASMTGHDVLNLQRDANGWVRLWTYQCAGAIVGRIETL